MINVGYAFPLEKLGSDISRNDYNYQSILSGLISWNNTLDDQVIIRLTKDTDPYYQDYIIPSKSSIFKTSPLQCQISESVPKNAFSVSCGLQAAVFGGVRKFNNFIFNAFSDVDIVNDAIFFANVQNINIGDIVKFTTSQGATLPVGILATENYKIASVVGNLVSFSDINNAPVNFTAIGVGSIVMTEKPPLQPPPVDINDPGDIVTLRCSVQNNGTSIWKMYYGATIRDWTVNQDYYYGNLVKYNGVVYFATFNIGNSTVTPNNDHANFIPFVQTWVAGVSYPIGTLVQFNGDMFQVVGNTALTLSNPSLSNTAYVFYAATWVANAPYNKGILVSYNNATYISINSMQNSTGIPSVDVENWSLQFPFPVNTAIPFTSTTSFRWYATEDASVFWLRNVSVGESTELTSIFLNASLQFIQTPSPYGRSVGLFPTSNYSYYPESNMNMWKTGNIYGPTNTNISATARQDYSATMVFNHVSPSTAKTINFINYDGPDLDQGLCIYLPVEVALNPSEISYPEDGFTFEFFIRIWPNANYTGGVTRDHIINKSQVYVYSATTLSAIPENNCSVPIAKFSMARTTNFYMFGENVSIPDKPVCYRATFVYSATQQKWITLDYYQLPDHVFIGPVGWIDPQNPANLDINNDVMPSNPNPTYVGYETAGFPLFQDPFSNNDLSPFKASNEDELNAFRNRIS